MDYQEKEENIELRLTEEERLDIANRDSGICQLCGGPGGVIHHIIPSSFERHKNKFKLCLLCYNCHNKVHVFGWEKYEKFLLERSRINEGKRN